MTINATNRSLAIAASVDGVLWSQYPLGDKPVSTARNVRYTGTFDDGIVQASGSVTNGGQLTGALDAGYVDGNSKLANGGSGGFGPSTDCDIRTTASEVVGSETILPRKGAYFLRSAIHYNRTQFNSFPPGYYKDYNQIGNTGTVGDIYGSQDKPRCQIALDGSSPFDFDEEVWWGFSVRLPANWYSESSSENNGGANMFMQVQAGTASRRVFDLSVRGAVGRPGKSDWYITVADGDQSTQDDGTGSTVTDLPFAPTDDDIGQWTDFVIRLRSNPFLVATNPFLNGIPNSKNQLYQPNRGILQVWKSTGPSRALALTAMNRVNVPVGLVPHATDVFGWNLRQYKYGWKKGYGQAPTPVWMGFDELRFGSTPANNTSFSDVDVDQRSMP